MNIIPSPTPPHPSTPPSVNPAAAAQVVDEDVYQRQGDNIITWCEAPPLIGEANNGVAAACGAAGVDLALSFQVRGVDVVPGQEASGSLV